MKTLTIICSLIVAITVLSCTNPSRSFHASSIVFKPDSLSFQADQTHDVAIINVTVSTNEVYLGVGAVNIDVGVRNEGDFVEKFNVTVYANQTSEPVIVDTYYVFSLGSLDEISIPFVWKTPTSPGNYTVIAEASTVDGETDTANNVKTSFVNVKADNTAPVIGIPYQDPPANYVAVEVHDSATGVGSVILSWSIDNGTTWSNNTMVYYEYGPYFHLYIDPGPDSAGKLLIYEIYAYDNANNSALRDNAGAYYVYIVGIPEFSSILTLLSFSLVTSVTALSYRKIFHKRE